MNQGKNSMESRNALIQQSILAPSRSSKTRNMQQRSFVSPCHVEGPINTQRKRKKSGGKTFLIAIMLISKL